MSPPANFNGQRPCQSCDTIATAITTASVPQSCNVPLIAGIHQNAPHAQYVARNGRITAWENRDFITAVKITGHKTLIIAGTVTSVCMAFPPISAVTEGYKVFAIIDL